MMTPAELRRIELALQARPACDPKPPVDEIASEIATIARIVEELESLPEAARPRVLRYLIARFGVAS